jgi:ribonuclease P protein component
VLSPLALRPRLQSADFQQALGTRPVARSAHFTVHFAVPSLARRKPLAGGAEPSVSVNEADLSTGPALEQVEPVDEVRTHHRVWRLGLVLPKRMARRSVTRSLIKHQARELWRLHAEALEQAGWLHEQQPVGNWVLRLKAPWPVKDFPSAASDALKQLVRAEIQSVLAHCARQGPRPVATPSSSSLEPVA